MLQYIYWGTKLFPEPPDYFSPCCHLLEDSDSKLKFRFCFVTYLRCTETRVEPLFKKLDIEKHIYTSSCTVTLVSRALAQLLTVPDSENRSAHVAACSQCWPTSTQEVSSKPKRPEGAVFKLKLKFNLASQGLNNEQIPESLFPALSWYQRAYARAKPDLCWNSSLEVRAKLRGTLPLFSDSQVSFMG